MNNNARKERSDKGIKRGNISKIRSDKGQKRRSYKKRKATHKQAEIKTKKKRKKSQKSRPKLSEFEKLVTKKDAARLEKFLYERAKKFKNRSYTMDYMMVMLMMKAGLRASEVGKLLIKDCHLNRNPAIICIAGKMRNDNEKDDILIPKYFAQRLSSWIKTAKPRKFVFEISKNVGITRYNVWARVKAIYNRLKLNVKYNCHSLRHRFGTDTYNASKDLEYARCQLRHKHLSATEIYIHFSQLESEEVKTYLDKMED